MKTNVLLFAVLLSVPAFAQWMPIKQVPVYQAILQVQAQDTFYIGGYNGQFYRSFDGGQSIQKDSVDLLGGWILDMQFSSPNIGYACGGTAFGLYQSPILKTVDAGINWDTLVTNKFGYDLHSLFFLNDQIGFFGGAGILIRTYDGGSSFVVDTLPGVGNVMSIHFFDLLNGLVNVRDEVYRTSDGGSSWTLALHDTNLFAASGNQRLVFPPTGQTGYYMNRGTKMYKTTDGGVSWTSMAQALAQGTLTEVQFVSPAVGYMTAADPMFFNVRGGIFKTTDGGLSWQEQIRSDSSSFSTISMVNALEGYAMAGVWLFKTTNGGLSWREDVPLKKFDLFPNPAKETVELSLGGRMAKRISLVDVNGKEVRTFEVQKKQLSLSGLARGTYYLQLEFVSGERSVQKVLLQ